MEIVNWFISFIIVCSPFGYSPVPESHWNVLVEETPIPSKSSDEGYLEKEPRNGAPPAKVTTEIKQVKMNFIYGHVNTIILSYLIINVPQLQQQ